MTNTVLSQATVDRMIARLLAQAAQVLRRTDLADYPGEERVTADRLLTTAIGWASR